MNDITDLLQNRGRNPTLVRRTNEETRPSILAIIEKELKTLKEQQVDLTPILTQLNRIETLLGHMKENNQRLIDKQIEVLHIFGLALKQQVDRR